MAIADYIYSPNDKNRPLVTARVTEIHRLSPTNRHNNALSIVESIG